MNEWISGKGHCAEGQGTWFAPSLVVCYMTSPSGVRDIFQLLLMEAFAEILT